MNLITYKGILIQDRSKPHRQNFVINLSSVSEKKYLHFQSLVAAKRAITLRLTKTALKA